MRMSYVQQQQAQVNSGEQVAEVMTAYEVQMETRSQHQQHQQQIAGHMSAGSAMANQQQQQQHHHDQSHQLAEQDGVSQDTITNGETSIQQQSSSRGDIKVSLDVTSGDDGSSVLQTDEGGVLGVIKTPNSYKYPLLRRYYEFGPWIGRNRKAICLGCRLQTSSSQPDRLLKHLNRCNALTEEEKVAVQDLMNERTANKRKKPSSVRLRHGDGDDSEYYGDDEPGLADDLSIPGLNTPQSSMKRPKREGPMDRNSQIDEALTKFIIGCRIPLKAIHSHEFVEFVKALDPNYRIPSKETITTVLIPRLLNII